MSRFDRPPVPVQVGPCQCKGTPHPDGDVVYLSPVLTMAGGMAARAAIAENFSDVVGLQERLARIWLSHGIVGWNFVDDFGQPIPYTAERAATALPYDGGGREVAEAADDLYAEAILRPLRERSSSSSPTGPTDASTSPQTTSTPSSSAPSSPPDSEASEPSMT